MGERSVDPRRPPGPPGGRRPKPASRSASFFRDPPAFDELATRVLAALVGERDGETPIRIWVPGCSTGEEAYSIAIVVAEQIAAARSACRVQIFATDVDHQALEIARAGTYPESIALEVTPSRLQRFFLHDGHRCTIAKSIRESVVFAVQNPSIDPPLCRLDLVSGRNVLTSSQPDFQSKLLSLFHFALNPGGYLFLGRAEGMSPLDDLFEPVSTRRRIFRRVGQGRRPLAALLLKGRLPEPRGRSWADRGQTDMVRRLEAALRATKEEHGHLVQQLEWSNEALKAANEEILSMNEELRSTSEELTTSQEELQSVNEELPTLNAQLRDKVHELTAVNEDLANLLVSTDIATVFLDSELRIKRFTTAAAQVLNLRSGDTGRPLSHLASNLVDVDLSREARTVLDAGITLEKEVAAQGGRQYLLRVLPCHSEGGAAQGVVLTFVEVTALKRTERALRRAREQVAEDLRRMTRLHEISTQRVGADVHTLLENAIRAAVDVTGAEMGTIQRADGAGVLTVVAQTGFDRPFLDFFARVDAQTDSACGAAAATGRRVLVEDVTTSPIFSARPALPIMIAAGVRAVQSTPILSRAGDFLGIFSTHYRQVHQFDDAELRWLDLLVRHAADLIEQQRAEERLARSHEVLEVRVADRTRWLALMHDVAQSINEASTWDEALHRVLQRLCATERWQIGFVYLPRPARPETIAPAVSSFEDDRFRAFHEHSMRQTYATGESLPGRVYADNAPFWAVDADALMAAIPRRAATATAAGLLAGAALPVVVQNEVIAVLEVFSDRSHASSDQLTTLMQNVSDQIGRVVERERTTARMADLVWREQQALLHTLHDSLGQTLTGVGMLSAGLSRQLMAADAATAGTAAEIARQTQLALDQVRLLAKKLFPVEVDAGSLMAVLRDLASATESLHKVSVRVEGDTSVTLRDGKIATELYRIAQEAVTNSIKHAQAKTITIRFQDAGGVLRLAIADDGIGISHAEPGEGAGLRIMRYRATSIGASLTVGRRPAGGTQVTCVLRQPPRPGKRGA